jgi:hypothetical protein
MNTPHDAKAPPPEHDPSDNRGMWLRDIPVELLGVLFPGLLYLSAALGVLLPPGVAALSEIERTSGETWGIVEGASEFFRIHEWTTLVVLILISYVLGHAFFRQDPKEVDRLSVLRIFPELEKNVSLAMKGKLGKITSGPQSGHDSPARLNPHNLNVEYPYIYLKQYLCTRGLYSLAAMVPWEGSGDNHPPERSKSFINNLKIRLLYHVPARCGLIVRNEGHIRLLSSVWYVARALAALTVSAMIIVNVRLLITGTWLAGPPLGLSFPWWITGWVLLTILALTFWGLILKSGQELLKKRGSIHPRRFAEKIGWGSLLAFCAVYTWLLSTPVSGSKSPWMSGQVAVAHASCLFGAWLGTLWLRRSIESSLHYMRVREIFFVLETARIAAAERPEFYFPITQSEVEAKAAGLKAAAGGG